MNTIRKAITTALIAGGTIAAGAIGVGMMTATASAQTATTTTAAADGTTTTPAPPTAGAAANGAPTGDHANRPDFDPAKGGHVGQNGTKEELLTGDTAAKVTAAATAAQPGATIERVETDAEGAAYEAHIVTADGKHVTLKFDAAYNVTATENGPGGR